MNKKILYTVEGAIIAALYVVFTYAQVILFPESVYAAVQFRVSEVLCMTAMFTPAAIPGLTIGCIIANIANGPFDMIFGSIASLLAALFIYLFRNVRIKKIPFLSALMPAFFNGLIVGWEIETFFVEGPFHIGSYLITGGFVALGELGVLILLGIPFCLLLEKRKLDKVIFKSR